MPVRTTRVSRGTEEVTLLRVVLITLDAHLAGAAERAAVMLRRELPGLTLSFHAASDWAADQDALERCRSDIERADIVFATMLFMEDHIQAVLPWLRARREQCDAMIGCMSAGEVVKLTRLGRFSMDGSQKGPMALLKRLRGGGKGGSSTTSSGARSSGAKQVAMLRRLPRILRFIPGTAQDVRAYFLTLQYWLAGSDTNIANMVRLAVSRYAAGPREPLRAHVKVKAPVEYPEVGLYHPKVRGRITAEAKALPVPTGPRMGTIGLLVMRSYVLGGDTEHYDAVIASLEARGFAVLPAFASGLDAREAIQRFFIPGGERKVDAVVSLTGFSLVGGPAYNDSKAAEDVLAALDVPYLAAQAIEFQTLEQWQAGDRGLMPIEATMMVAIPELDGATGPILFGGRTEAAKSAGARAIVPHDERIAMLTARIEKLVRLRQAPPAERRIAIVLYDFPPNSGATGTAAFLSVFASLFNTLKALAAAGYDVELPRDVAELRERILEGNAARYGTDANVHHRLPVNDHVRRERWLDEIETQWGPAPGRQQSDGSSLFVLGAQFGQVFVGVQPAFGYEGDPMRLLFEKGFTPTHAFSAFYRYLREDFDAHAVVHFGTHGALEFMPGKQTALSGACWPDRLIGDLPNLYLYAANNPSEGMIAKRRSAATLVSYLTPPVGQAGLYKGLVELKESIERWRTTADGQAEERQRLGVLVQAQGAALDLCAAEPAWADTARGVSALRAQVQELETSLIPHGLHVIGETPSAEERCDLLQAIGGASPGLRPERREIEALVAGAEPTTPNLEELAGIDRLLTEEHELPALLHALDGGFVRPVAGGDLIKTTTILPTGRNLHGFDPFRIPSAFAIEEGARHAELLLARHREERGELPQSVALVLWGTDNLKSEGGPIAQALALIGARPRFDGYGRLAGAELIPLEELGRPRIDVVVTLSGIFRDLLPLQTRMLAEATYLAASVDEPLAQNAVRKHALAHQAAHGGDLETAALRVFSNADGVYGSNVNHLVDSGAWEEEDELAETYTRRKCFAYGRDGKATQRGELLRSVLSEVELAYQNLESVELGVTTIDHYFDTLGGIGRAVQRAKGAEVPVYIGDQTRGAGVVRTLSEQVALETRTRMLNPKWYEGMLKHGHEGVRQIEAAITNTMGWSATTGQVDPWVYRELTQTFVLDDAMRERLAALNPKASAKVANRLLEAHERHYWNPDETMIEALQRAGEELEDRLEGIGMGMAA